VRPSSGPAPVVAPPARNFTLVTSDRLRIGASYWPGRMPRAPGVLLLHGFGASRVAVAPLAAWLGGQGFAVLAIDFRGHGTSDQVPRGLGATETPDARAGFDWLKARQQGGRIAILAISQGGAAVLSGRGGPIPADALVLQAVYPDLRRAIRNRIAWIAGRPIAWLGEPFLSYQAPLRFGRWPGSVAPVEAVRGYDGPVFVLGGGADPFTPPAETRLLCRAVPHCLDFWIVPGLDHFAMADLDSPAYRARLAAFLNATLGAPR